MQSCAWMNGQYQQFGAPSQSSQTAPQLTNDTMSNQRYWTANSSPQYTTSNKGVQPLQSAHFTSSNGAYHNRQTSDWQTSGVPHQAVFSQQPVGGKPEYYFQNAIKRQVSKSGNHPLLVPNGLQFSDCHQNKAQNALSQSTHDMVTANTPYSQQNISAHWNQSMRTDHVNSVSEKNCSVSQGVYGKSTISVLQNSTMATSLQHEQAVRTHIVESAVANNRLSGLHQNNGQQSTQQGLFPSFPPPSYATAASRSFGINSLTTNSSQSEHILPVSNRSQNTQQPRTQPISRRINGMKDTSSIQPNTHGRQYETSNSMSKTGLLLNTYAPTHEEMHSQKIIASIAEDLQKSFCADSGGNPLKRDILVSQVRMIESSQNEHPAASSVAESYNLNSFQSFPLNSGPPLPKTTHSVISGAQNSVYAPSQQGAYPISSQDGTAKGYGNGNTKLANKTFPKIISEHPISSSIEPAQLMKLPDFKSSLADTSETFKNIFKGADGSIHSSPGRTGTRAVAVVQPLSQERYPVSSEHTASIDQSDNCSAKDKSFGFLEKLLIQGVAKNQMDPYLREESYSSPANSNHMTPNKSVTNHSAAYNHGTFLASSKSSGHQDLSKRQKYADDAGSELAIKMQVDQRVSPTAQQLVDLPEKECDPKTSVCELSLLPTIPWTPTSLKQLILNGEEAQMRLATSNKKTFSPESLANFWKGDTAKLRTGWYKRIITEVNDFCSELTQESVILTQVRPSSVKQMKGYHVLKPEEIYSEPLYRSSWMNVNEQLDDIDKEFGFNSYLNHKFPTVGTDNSDQIGTFDSIPSQIVTEMSNEVLSKTELKTVDSVEENQATTVEAASTQKTSKGTDSTDSVNPYSFQIEVLHPKEAKLLFEQGHSMDKDSQPESITNNYLEVDLPKAIDVPLEHWKDTRIQNMVVNPIEQVCCIKRWVELIWDSNSNSSSKCQCNKKQSNEGSIDNNLNQEKMVIQMEDKLRAITPDKDCASVTEEENEVKSEENVIRQMMRDNWPEQCTELNQTIDLTEDDDIPHTYSDRKTKNTSNPTVNSNMFSLTVISADEDFSTSENDISDQMPDLAKESLQDVQVEIKGSSPLSGADNNVEEKKAISSNDSENRSDHEMVFVKDRLKSTGSRQLCPRVRKYKEVENLTDTESESEEASCMSDLEGDSGQAQLICKGVKESSLGGKEKNQINALETTIRLGGKHVETVDATDKVLSPKKRRIELVLFGSGSQNKCASVGGKRRRISLPGDVSNAEQRPPEVISVITSPLKRKSRETAPLKQYSDKPKVHENFQPNTKRLKPKVKLNQAFSGGNLKMAKRIAPTNTEKLPFPSPKRSWNAHAIQRRMRSKSKAKKHGQENIRKYTVTLKSPAHQERTNTENGSRVAAPLQNTVLKFSVLPKSFDFKDDPSGRKETSDPVSNKPELVEGKDNIKRKAGTTKKGSWYANPEKKYCPLRSPTVPKTTNLFQAYRKKYMQKTQTSVDE